MEFSQKTKDLLERMNRVALRQEYVFDTPKITELIQKTYLFLSLSVPTIVWAKDITDEHFLEAANAASATNATNATNATWATWATSATSATWATRATNATWATSAARATSATNATSAASDYDFDWFIFAYEFLQKNKGNKNDYLFVEAMELFLQLKEAGMGYFAEKDGILYVCPNPIIRLDEKLQYHCETGPSIHWENGLELWYIHGVAVNEKIVKTPEKLTKKDWLNEKNMEVKRIIQDRMPDFPQTIGGKSVKTDALGELLQVDLENDPEKTARYVKMKDTSTDRIYYLRVPPKIKTPTEGIAWSFGMKAEKYKPTLQA